jgi:hemoglobin-like flavoprotein
MGLKVDVLRNSFAVVIEREPELMHNFYEVLFSRHPQTRAMFQRNREAQERMLRDALVAVMDHLEDAGWLNQRLSALGAQHATFGVTDDMYDWVGAALLQAVGDVAGPDWTPELADAWIDAYAAIAGIMKQGARSMPAMIPAQAMEAEATRPY